MKKSIKFAATATALTALALNISPVLAQTWTARTANQVQETLNQSTDGVYVIQWGDTLTTIAKATGYSVEDLAVINEIADVDLIHAGAVLYFNEVANTVSYVEAGVTEVATYELPVETTYVVTETAEWVAPETEVVETAPVVVAEDVTEWVAPVVEETLAPVTEAPVVEETVAPVTEAPVVEETVAPVTEAPVVEETLAPVTEAPVVEETVAPVTEAPVVEETVAPVTEAPVVEETVAAATSGTNAYGGIVSEAKEWIAMKESGGNYDIWNPSGKYYGRYQLTVSYLNGDLSPENQEKVADEYVLNRYGSWEAAKAFWEANGWY